MSSSGVPDRQKAALCGVVGAVAGVLAMQWFERHVLEQVFPEYCDPPKESPSVDDDPIESKTLMQPLYQPGENTYDTLGREVYATISGDIDPDDAKRAQIKSAAEWALGLTAGLAYGSTRTTTRHRDIAGGFFLGTRMAWSEALVAPLVGLHAGPTRFSPMHWVAVHVRYWSFSFVMTAVTRALYRLFSPEDW